MKLYPALSALLAACLIATMASANNAPCPPPSQGFAHNAPRGYAVAIGGALKYDNAEVWSRLVTLAGGKGAKFAVFATASGSPEKTSASIVKALEQHGAIATFIPLAPRLKTPTVEEVLRDPKHLETIGNARGVFFSGGEQARIIQTLYAKDGKPTEMLEAIWGVYRKGGVVAGTSAGAAIMSAAMFRDVPDVFSALLGGAKGLRDGQELDRGLGFVGDKIFVDQHFLKRGRIGRLVPAMAAKGYQLGLGIEENTAAIFCGDNVEMLGARGSVWVDLSNAKTNKNDVPFSVQDARISYLDHGDSINVKTGKVSVAAHKLDGLIDPNSKQFKPYNDSVRFYADVLGDNTIVNAMSALLDSPAATTSGLALPSDFNASEATAQTGFEFKLRKASDTIGYFTSSRGGEDYTVLNMRLDISPVRLAQPMYQPYKSPGSNGEPGKKTNRQANPWLTKDNAR